MRKFKQAVTRVFLPLLCLAVLLAPLTVCAQASSSVAAQLRPDIAIVIDGSNRTFYNVNGKQVHPISCNGTTYLPLRAIGELMGKLVTWDQSTKTASLGGVRADAAVAGTPDTSAKVQAITVEVRSDFTVEVDGQARTFADAKGQTVYPLLYQGSTYLPIRAIGELMGKSVAWDGKTNTVTLSGGTDSEVTDADVIVGGTTLLTTEQAKAKALAHAGVAAEEAIFTKEKLDKDDGRQEYEFEFCVGNQKYDYEIDAKTGDILSHEIKSGTPLPSTGSPITREKAQEIALAKVPGAASGDIKKLKLDRDDGRQIYEVEIIYKEKEYDIEIDASSGTVLEFSSESIYD